MLPTRYRNDTQFGNSSVHSTRQGGSNFNYEFRKILIEISNGEDEFYM